MVRRTGGALRRAGSFVVRRSGGAIRRAATSDAGAALTAAAREVPGGAAAAVVYRALKGRVSSPLSKAGVIGLASLACAFIRPLRPLGRGMAGAAAFAATTTFLPE